MNRDLQTLRVLRDDGATRLLRVAIGPGASMRRLIKVRAGSPAPAKAVCLYTEQEVLTRHALACALPFERLEGSGQEAVLVFGDPGGVGLDRVRGRPLAQWLAIALRMVEALDEVHRAGLLHRDLRPESFLWSPKRLYIMDFTHAVRLRREYRDLDIPDADTRRLRYIAPELTGRFNRPVDYRADYYGLGAVLYELLTGTPPFAALDPEELIYQHLALEPDSPGDRNPSLPDVLSQLLLRLLAKDPGQRYQSAGELLSDLGLARDVVAGNRNDDARLVSTPATLRPLEVPHRLYGRDEERRRLLDALERAFGHDPQLLFLSGPSGIGKTTLIRETYLAVTRERAFYVSGKFDQLQRGRPYSAWVDALDELVQFILAEPSASLESWRCHLHEVLGSHAGVLATLIPGLHTLLGALPAPPELPPSELKARLSEALVRFFGVFRQAQRPLVIFLDDLQWIDIASLELLETLAQRLHRVPLLVIAAYRDNEVAVAHPLALTCRALRSHSRLALTELTLGPLDVPAVTEMLAAGSGRSTEDVSELSTELVRRTGGNPFFLWQLLRTMRDNDWLFVDTQQHRWAWDLDAVRRAGFADHVLDLMLHRFRSLPARTRELLSWAACLGTVFDLDILSWLADEAPSEVYRNLQPALEEEFIRALSAPEVVNGSLVIRRAGFVHDRMQEAAYRAIDGEALVSLHRHIGALMRERLPHADRDARVTEIAGHLNIARELITTVDDALDLAYVNLAAARKAKAAAAFEAAAEYMRLGMSRLPPDLWERDAELAYQLYRERGDVEYLNSEFEAAEWFVNCAIHHERDVYRRVDLYHMLVVQYTLRARYGQAIAVAGQGLELLGESLPAEEFEVARDRELAAVDGLLRGRTLEVLGELAPMSDGRQRAVMKLLTSLGPPCYRAHPRLWSVIVAREVRLSLEYGSVAAGGYAYPGYGGLLTHVGAGDGSDCAALYRATEGLMERLPDPADRSVAHLMMGSSLCHWFAPMKAASREYMEAYRTGQESGNLQYAVYGFGHNTYCRYFQGEPLDELIPEALGYLEYSRQRRNLWGIDLIIGALRVFQLLHGDWTGAAWPHKDEPEEAYLARCEGHENLQVLCIYHVMRASALLLRGDVDAAAVSIREAERRLDSVSVQGLLPATQFPVLKALVLAAAPAALDADAATVDRYLDDTAERYGAWARHAPENFGHWRDLMVAERARRAGDVDKLIEAYDAALQGAQQQSCWLASALIARRAEDYWRQRGRRAFAAVYGQQAQQALQQGRADAALVPGEAVEEDPVAREPDMDAVIRIAQALSLHTALDKLVPEIIRHVARQTGAQRVVLLLAQNDVLRVVMESGVRGQRYHEQPPLLDSVASLPQSVIRYVARTQQTMRFGPDDIGTSLLLSNECYLRQSDDGGDRFSGSALCVPLSYLGELIGVLYLEHGLAADAFDRRREPLVEFLAAQAAISVRSIELISELADEAQARRDAELRTRSADAEIAVRREMEDRLTRLANTDPLTELANRRRFIGSLEEAWSRRDGGTGETAAVLLLDIDHFKEINDRHGHAAGDRVLCQLADTLRDTLRSADLPARIGGEEFAVLVDEGGEARAQRIAVRLCRRIANRPARIDDEAIALTVSIGVARMRPGDPSHESVLHRADQALYRAKGEGRNRVCCDIDSGD